MSEHDIPQSAAAQEPAPPGAPAEPLTAQADQQTAMFAHLGGVVGFLPALIIWLVFKDRGPKTAVESKEALNWQITFTIAYAAAWVVTTVLSSLLWVLGTFLWLVPFAVWALNVVWSIMGSVKVNGGGSYRYPLTFRFIK